MSRRASATGGAMAALLVVLVVGGWVGVGLAVGAGAVAYRLVRRAESPARRRERQRVAADLPFAAHLLAEAMRAGAPTEHGLRAVGTALGGAAGRYFVRVADGLHLGLSPADAWAPMRSTPEGNRFADAVLRTADSGAAVARSLDRLAESLRGAGAVRVESASQRAGVLMVLPLGLCFLPAFVFAGVVPVIAAELGGVLH